MQCMEHNRYDSDSIIKYMGANQLLRYSWLYQICMILVNFLRGLSDFRAFDSIRYFSRPIIIALLDTLYFYYYSYTPQ